jgi:hypothetical protein
MKKFQRFVGYVSASLLIVLLISSPVKSQVSIKSNGYFQNDNMNNITKVKETIKVAQQTTRVTRNNSDCAKELLQVLSQYMNVNSISAQWSYNGTQYIYEEGTQSNNKPSKNEEKLVKLKVTQTPYNLLVSSDHQEMNNKMINEVQDTFRSHGVQINYLEARGNYPDGQPCGISFPCGNNSYCVKPPQ